MSAWDRLTSRASAFGKHNWVWLQCLIHQAQHSFLLDAFLLGRALSNLTFNLKKKKKKTLVSSERIPLRTVFKEYLLFVSKNILFGRKMMVKSGLDKFILKSLYSQNSIIRSLRLDVQALVFYIIQYV